MFNPDQAGDAVRDALARGGASAGSTVSLLIDGFGSRRAADDYFADLAERGGEHCVFNPSYGRRYLLRNHQKLVDRRRARSRSIGGANIDDDLFERPRAGAWRDLWLSDRRPARSPAEPLFRHAVPLGDAQERRSCARCGG